MKVRAQTMFVDESGRHQYGDEFEMADTLAVIRIKAGVVKPVGAVETATTEEPETAVSRRGRR